jgi:hypothetical protein
LEEWKKLNMTTRQNSKGGMEGWNVGRVGTWNAGREGTWYDEKMEWWNDGKLARNRFLHYSNIPSLRFPLFQHSNPLYFELFPICDNGESR